MGAHKHAFARLTPNDGSACEVFPSLELWVKVNRHVQLRYETALPFSIPVAQEL